MKTITQIKFLLTGLVLLIVSLSTSAKENQKKPNIILIMADDLGFETIGCYGNTSYKTPRIDKMAEEGVKFEHCYSQPLCTPSRVKIMTGKSNFRNYERWGYLNQNETTFAHILKSQGYSTCIAGKWQLKGDEYAPYKAGFDEYLLWQLTFTSYNERYKNPRVLENGVMKKYNNSEYGPQLFTNFLMNFMERKKDGPFLVYYPMALTHRPFVPTPDSDNYDEFFIPGNGNAHSTKSEVKYFKDEVEYMDKIVGQIIDKTHQLGIGENTLILFVGDNGTNHGVFSQMGDKKVEGDKGATNDFGIHVPFVAYWDGKIQPGQVNNNLVDFSDFLPTFCDVAGVELNETFITDGISFLPQMLGEEYTAHEYLFCHFDPGKDKFEKKRFVHNVEWKLYESGEIYNKINDPMEKKSLAENDLNSEQKKLFATFREVFPKMVKEEVNAGVDEEKE
jgi:arylsulfatase A